MNNEEAINRLFMLRDELRRQIAICTDSVKLTAFCDTVRLYDKAIEALKAQKLGEWVKFKDENGYTKFMCSNCRFTRGRDKPKYCPNCGSNNRGCKE